MTQQRMIPGIGTLSNVGTNQRMLPGGGIIAPVSSSGTTFTKTILGTLNISSVQIRDVLVNRVGNISLFGSPLKHTTTSTKVGSITTASNLVGGGAGVTFNQNTSGSITLTSILTDAVTFVRSWSSQIMLSGAIAKPVSKLLSGVITLTGAVSKLITKAKFIASLTLSGIATGFGFTPSPGGGALSRGIRFMRKFIGRR